MDVDAVKRLIKRQNTEIVWALGDLQLVVLSQNGENCKIFRVHTAFTKAASPQWDTFHPYMPESFWPHTLAEKVRDRFGCYTHVFVEDHVEAVGHVLYAAHHQHHKVPAYLSFPALVQIAEICERHDVIGVLQPYLRNWAYVWTPKLLVSGYEMWIYVAYHFGYFDIFRVVAEHLAQGMMLGPDDEYFHEDFNLSKSGLKGDILSMLISISSFFSANLPRSPHPNATRIYRAHH